MKTRLINTVWFVFACSLFTSAISTVGCTQGQIDKYNKAAGPTTRAVEAITETSGAVAATQPGTPVGSLAAIITAIGAAIIAAEKVITPIVNQMRVNNTTQPTTPSPFDSQSKT